MSDHAYTGKMKIELACGVMVLDDESIPTTDDMNDIISSVTRNDDDADQFQRLCDESCGWPEGMTNAEFLQRCEEWVAQDE